MNPSADSSQAKIALLPVEPLSITIPESFAFEVTPLFNSIKLSFTTIFVVETVVVAPFTVKSPVSVKSVNCTSSPVPTPILVLSVAPLSATGSVVPSPTII